MVRSLWEEFRSLLGQKSEMDDEGGEDFVSSPLELCVRNSLGSLDDEIKREIYKIDEQA